MKCDRCHEQEATFYLKQSENGQVFERHLCRQCAEESGVWQELEAHFQRNWPGHFLQNSLMTPLAFRPWLLPGLLREKQASTQEMEEIFWPKRSKPESFSDQDMLDRINDIYQEIQAKGEAGTVPHPQAAGAEQARAEKPEQLRLRERLKRIEEEKKQALACEDYEQAARLRDEAKKIRDELA